MTPRDLRNIHTTGNSCRDTLPCANMVLADGEASWSLLPSSVSLLSGGTVQPENTYSHILKATGQVWENQKRISINTNHSYHQRSSPKNNSIFFSFFFESISQNVLQTLFFLVLGLYFFNVWQDFQSKRWNQSGTEIL